MFDPYDDRYVESETDRIIQGDKEMGVKSDLARMTEHLQQTTVQAFTRLARVLDEGDFYLKYDGKDRFQIVGKGMDDDEILTPSELAEWIVNKEREA